MTEKKPSLVEHAKRTRKDLARAKCPICQLPKHVRDQVAEASAMDITRKEIIRWLEDVYDAKVSLGEIASHVNGRHDE